ncbi:uncharacterized protein ACB058_008406 [Synchiropus picturatus]
MAPGDRTEARARHRWRVSLVLMLVVQFRAADAQEPTRRAGPAPGPEQPVSSGLLSTAAWSRSRPSPPPTAPSSAGDVANSSGISGGSWAPATEESLGSLPAWDLPTVPEALLSTPGDHELTLPANVTSPFSGPQWNTTLPARPRTTSASATRAPPTTNISRSSAGPPTLSTPSSSQSLVLSEAPTTLSTTQDTSTQPTTPLKPTPTLTPTTPTLTPTTPTLTPTTTTLTPTTTTLTPTTPTLPPTTTTTPAPTTTSSTESTTSTTTTQAPTPTLPPTTTSSTPTLHPTTSPHTTPAPTATTSAATPDSSVVVPVQTTAPPPTTTEPPSSTSTEELPCNVTEKFWVKTVLSIELRRNRLDLILKQNLSKGLSHAVQRALNDSGAALQVEREQCGPHNLTLAYYVTSGKTVLLSSLVLEALAVYGVHRLLSDVRQHAPLVKAVLVPVAPWLPAPSVHLQLRTVLRFVGPTDNVYSCSFVQMLEQRLENAFDEAQDKVLETYHRLTVEIVKKTGDASGSWFKDPTAGSQKIYLLSGVRNHTLLEFGSLQSFSSNTPPPRVLQLPASWQGTGHVVYGGFLFYHKADTPNQILKVSLESGGVVDSALLPGAGRLPVYGLNPDTYLHLAVDQLGLWALHADPDYAGNLVLTKLDKVSLAAELTWDTPCQSRDAEGAFLICGTLYVVYNWRYGGRSTVQCVYDVHDTLGRRETAVLFFPKRSTSHSSLSYHPADQQLFTWDDGYQSVYRLETRRSPPQAAGG